MFMQYFNDDVIGFENINVVQGWSGVRQVSVVWVNWVGDFQIVFLVDGVVVWIVVVSGMYCIGIGIQCYVVVKDCWYVEIEEWMFKVYQFKFRILYCCQNSVVCCVNVFYYVFNQVFCQDQCLVVNLYQCIVEFRRQRDSVVGWQGLWCGGLDNQ